MRKVRIAEADDDDDDDSDRIGKGPVEQKGKTSDAAEVRTRQTDLDRLPVDLGRIVAVTDDGDDIDDGDDFEFLAEQALFGHGVENETADAAESVNCDFFCHDESSQDFNCWLFAH